MIFQVDNHLTIAERELELEPPTGGNWFSAWPTRKRVQQVAMEVVDRSDALQRRSPFKSCHKERRLLLIVHPWKLSPRR